MPLKKGHGRGKGVENEKRKKALQTKEKGALLCFFTPGPKYQLKTLVGYNDHCISRYRNPAYTFGLCAPHALFEGVESPGPKYMLKERKPQGFTFGLAAKRPFETIGPGPKYKLQDVPRGPFFSIKWKTKLRKASETPGPSYYIKPVADAPAFSMGLRPVIKSPIVDVGHYSFSVSAVKPRAPMYTMVGRRTLRFTSDSPGPIYALHPFKPAHAFSFGIKHHECAPPLVTECDKQC